MAICKYQPIKASVTNMTHGLVSHHLTTDSPITVTGDIDLATQCTFGGKTGWAASINSTFSNICDFYVGDLLIANIDTGMFCTDPKIAVEHAARQWRYLLSKITVNKVFDALYPKRYCSRSTADASP